jgi:hypothetical protein
MLLDADEPMIVLRGLSRADCFRFGFWATIGSVAASAVMILISLAVMALLGYQFLRGPHF